MSKIKSLLILSAFLSISACASRASGVAPLSISSSDYNGLSCEDAKAKLEVSRQTEYALTKKQNNAATADAAAVFLLAVPLGSVFGADVKGELAQAKGEVLALGRYVESTCAKKQ